VPRSLKAKPCSIKTSRTCCPPDWGDGYSNAWLGTTTEDAERFKLPWPILARIPAIIQFISYEPGPLGRVDIAERLPDWIICGGDSGGHARALNAD
jgi:protein gp37